MHFSDCLFAQSGLDSLIGHIRAQSPRAKQHVDSPTYRQSGSMTTPAAD